MVEQAAPDTPIDRPGWVLEFDERFDGPDLDRSRWIPHHLPHWSSRDRSAARYRLRDGALRLRIEADQPVSLRWS